MELKLCWLIPHIPFRTMLLSMGTVCSELCGLSNERTVRFDPIVQRLSYTISVTPSTPGTFHGIFFTKVIINIYHGQGQN